MSAHSGIRQVSRRRGTRGTTHPPPASRAGWRKDKMKKELREKLMAGTISPARYVPTYYEMALNTHHAAKVWLSGWRLALVCAGVALVALAVGWLRK